MSLKTVANQFVELCRQGKNFDVMRTLYAPDIVSVEGDGKETAGQGPVIKKSEDWVSDKTFNGETVAGPFFNGANPDQFAVYFTLDVTPKATGKRITLEEVGVYTVNKDDKITARAVLLRRGPLTARPARFDPVQADVAPSRVPRRLGRHRARCAPGGGAPRL